MKVAIETLDDKQGYILTTDSGETYIVKDIDEAIALKNELESKKW